MHVAEPVPRDNKERPACIPDIILQRKAAGNKKAEKTHKLEREIEEELGDDYVLDLKKNYDIEGDQKFDNIPEMWEGHNIADYIDPEIEEVNLQSQQEKSIILKKCVFNYFVYCSTEIECSGQRGGITYRSWLL